MIFVPILLYRCASNVGRQGGKQQMILNQSCLMVGIALHQFLHVLGFFHEQSRRDRDKYIRINYDEVNKRKLTVGVKFGAARAANLKFTSKFTHFPHNLYAKISFFYNFQNFK